MQTDLKLKETGVLVLLVAACVSEDFADGQFTCKSPGSASECPAELVCASDLRCRKSVGDAGESGGSGGVILESGVGGGLGGLDSGGQGGTPSGGSPGTGGTPNPCAKCSVGQVCYNNACCTPKDPCNKVQCGGLSDGCGKTVNCGCNGGFGCKTGKCCPPRLPVKITSAWTTGSVPCPSNKLPSHIPCQKVGQGSCDHIEAFYPTSVKTTGCVVADFGVKANLNPVVVRLNRVGAACGDTCQYSSDPSKNLCLEGNYAHVFHAPDGVSLANRSKWIYAAWVDNLSGAVKDVVVNPGITRFIIVCRGAPGHLKGNVGVHAIESRVCL